MSTGTQVAPDMLQPDFFPDSGPDVKDVSENLDVWRRAVPPETMHTTELAWDVSEKTRLELYMIWKLTGNLEMIENIDEGKKALGFEIVIQSDSKTMTDNEINDISDKIITNTPKLNKKNLNLV